MTICPIAIAVGCARCPVVKVCPVKGLLGDAKPPQAAAQPEPEPTKPARKAAAKPSAKPAAKAGGRKAKR
jgi:hypothetical protein